MARMLLIQRQFISAMAGLIHYPSPRALLLEELAVKLHLLLHTPAFPYRLLTKLRCLVLFLAPRNSDLFLNGTHVL